MTSGKSASHPFWPPRTFVTSSMLINCWTSSCPTLIPTNFTANWVPPLKPRGPKLWLKNVLCFVVLPPVPGGLMSGVFKLRSGWATMAKSRPVPNAYPLTRLLVPPSFAVSAPMVTSFSFAMLQPRIPNPLSCCTLRCSNIIPTLLAHTFLLLKVTRHRDRW